MVLTFDKLTGKLIFQRGRKTYPRKSDMLTTTLDIVDPLTGEVQSKTFKEIGHKKPQNREFLMMHQDKLKYLAELELTPAALRVLLYLIAECDWANKVVFERPHVIYFLRITRQTFRVAFNELLSKGIVRQDFGATNACFIDPSICWKGHDKTRLAAEREWESTPPLPLRRK